MYPKHVFMEKQENFEHVLIKKVLSRTMSNKYPLHIGVLTHFRLKRLPTHNILEENPTSILGMSG